MEGSIESADDVQGLVRLVIDAMNTAACEALPETRVAPVSLNIGFVATDADAFGGTPEASASLTRRTLTVAFLEARVTAAGNTLLTATAAYRSVAD